MTATRNNTVAKNTRATNFWMVPSATKSKSLKVIKALSKHHEVLKNG